MRVLRLFILTAFVSSACAVTGFFGTIEGQPECTQCTEHVVSGVCKDTGELHEPRFSECLCQLGGGTEFLECYKICDKPAQQVISAKFYNYCIFHYKNMCNGAQRFADEKIWEENCGKDAKSGDSPKPAEEASGKSGGNLVKISPWQLLGGLGIIVLGEL